MEGRVFMGSTPRQLTGTSTLENLRQKAKRWLEAPRAQAEQARARLKQVYPNVLADVHRRRRAITGKETRK
jgi:hypothetical protein